MRFVETDRIERFLGELRRTGDAHRAAALASPACGGHAPGYSTFLSLRHRKREFRAAWDAALAQNQALRRRMKRLALAVLDAVEAA